MRRLVCRLGRRGACSQPPSAAPKFVFVGGKGGVGKTTTAAGLAWSLSRTQRTLLVSTDPAHSLADCLYGHDNDDPAPGERPAVERKDLSAPVLAFDESTNRRLWACEISPQRALQELQDGLQLDKLSSLPLFQRLPHGQQQQLAGALGALNLAELFDPPPPGMDEAAALASLLQLQARNQAAAARGEAPLYEAIVVDTAPTGHTLRMLTLPRLVFGSLSMLGSMLGGLDKPESSGWAMFSNPAAAVRDRLASTVRGLVGLDAWTAAIGQAEAKVSELSARLEELQRMLNDPSCAQFVVVALPTRLAVLETRRLVAELSSRGVEMAGVVVNQMPTDGMPTAEMAQLQGPGPVLQAVNRLNAQQRQGFEEAERHLGAIADALDEKTQLVQVPVINEPVCGPHGIPVYAQHLSGFLDASGAN